MDLVYIGNWLNGEGAAAYLDGIGSYFGTPGWYYVTQGEPGQLPIVTGTYTAPPVGTPAGTGTPSSGGSGGSAPAAPSAPAASAAPSASAYSAPAAPSAAATPNSRRKYLGSDFKQEVYGDYGTEYVTPYWFQGAGYYDQISDEGTQPVYSFLGAENPDAQYFNPTANGRFMFDPATGQFVTAGSNPYERDSGLMTGAGLGSIESAQRGFHKDTSLEEQYGPLGRDRFLSAFYDPYKNVAGVLSPDEFINASYRSQLFGDPTFDTRYEGVFKGSDNKAEAGSANNPAVPTLALLNAYMNQPALLAQRGGQAFDWSQVPQLAEMYAQGQEQAAKQAQMNHDVNTNTGGIIGGLSFGDLLKGISVWAPGLAPGLGGFTQGGFGGALSAIENVGAGQVLGSLGTKALGIVSPELGQIAGIAQGLNSLPGAFGGSSLTSMLGGSDLGGMLGLGGGDYGMPSGADWGLVEGGAATNVAGGLPTMPNPGLPMPTVDEMDKFLGSDWQDTYVNGTDAARQALISQVQANPEWVSSALGAAGAAAGAMPQGPAPSDYRYEDIGAGAPEGVKPAGISIGQMLGGAQKVLGLAQQISGLLGGGAEQQQSPVPQRRQGQTEEQYQTEVSSWAAEYLDLDVEAMARAGLEPGSPEYMQYILNQADSVIEQIFSHAPEALRNGETAGDLSAALRDLSKSELLQLQRALYVRGSLGQIMGSGEYVDPFSGISEQTMGEGMFAPSVAAYQRGMARNVDSLAGLRGNDARTFLDNLTGRNVDIFDLNAMGRAGMLRAQMIAAALEGGDLSEEDKKRLLAMQSGLGSATDWAGVINQTGDQFINQLQGDQGALDLYNAIFGGQ